MGGRQKVTTYLACPGGHVQESAHAFSFLGGLFGVRHTARDFLGFVAFESAVPTTVQVEFRLRLLVFGASASHF